MNFSDILGNNIYFGICLGLIITIIIYSLNTDKKKQKSNFKKYLEIMITNTTIIILGLYIKGNKGTNSQSGGGLEDINLDDPGF